MKSEKLFLEKSQLQEGASVKLPPSKSESNRYLILNALSGKPSSIINLSDSDDTLVLKKAMKSNKKIVNVYNAGTAMRFLTAYYVITNQRKVLTGSDRMLNRPIGILVQTLRTLGANIEYLGKRGYPPIEIKGFNYSGVNEIEIDGTISSQFVSALMMIGPLIPGLLTLHLKGKVVSSPYIHLTAGLMKDFGIGVAVKKNKIEIPEGTYRSRKVKVDGDWSSAAYWYSLFRLSGNKNLKLLGFSHHPRQGDSKIISLMAGFGIKTKPIRGGYLLTKGKRRQTRKFQLLENPDLAQALIVLCALLKVKAQFTGLSTLFIKETDRIKALKIELKKFNVEFFQVAGDKYALSFLKKEIPESVIINSHDDHRMAMSFSPACLVIPLWIENPEVVAKSYPKFWQQLFAKLQKPKPDLVISNT